MKKLIIFLFLIIEIFAEKLEITSQKFEIDEKNRVSKFFGEVKVLKGDDRIEAQEVIVTFSKDRKPLKYEVKGDVNFSIRIDTKEYKGSANSASYSPDKKEYLLIGNANIVETTTGKKIFANKIFLNEIDGKAEVFGDENKPVKFIFTINEDKK